MQLDEHTPRPFSPGRPLISLLNEDEEVAPGEHTFLAAVFTPEQVHADAVSFRVEPARRTQAKQDAFAVAVCFLLLPEPTVNGQGDRALELLAVLLDPHGFDQAPATQAEHEVVIQYVTTGDAGVARGTFPLGVSALLEKPPAGDVQIEVSCQRDGKEVARSQRTVTLNPELTGVQQ